MHHFSSIGGPNYKYPECAQTGQGCYSNGDDRFCVIGGWSFQHAIKSLNRKDPEEAFKRKIKALEGYAIELVRTQSPHHEPLLKERARKLGLKDLDWRTYRSILKRAKSVSTGVSTKRRGSRALKSSETPFLWDGILPAGRSTCIVGLPKTFKSTTVIHAIAAWHNGAASFLGQGFTGECPPLIIVGTDQNEADWVATISGSGLPAEVDEEGISSPIVELWSAEQGLYLDEDGIEEIRSVVAEYPNAILLVDSLRKTTLVPLGLAEKEIEMIEPLQALELAVAPYSPTIIYIHHSGKGRATDNPVLASGGSTALPGHVSNMVGLSKMSDSDDEQKIKMWIDGRCGPDKQLYFRRTDTSFELIAGGAELDLQERMQAAQKRLNPDAEEVLLVLHQSAVEGHWMTSGDIAVELKKNPSDKKDLNWVNRKLIRPSKNMVLPSIDQ